MTWQPLSTVPDDLIGHSILVWVPKNRCVFAVVPYASHGRDLLWWGSDPDNRTFPHRATHWMPMPKPPTKTRVTR